MVDISSGDNKINITASTSGNKASVNATPDMAMYYSNKSREWAISDKIVNNEDYSSKYYANESKKQADISTAKTTEVVENGNNAVSNIESARDNAITDVNTAGAIQVALATEQATIATNKTSEVVASGNTALANITTAKNNAITSITNQETTSKTSLIDEGATQVGLIQNEGATQVANVQSTGFYMRDDKLYFINSQGEETEFKSGGSGLEVCDIGTALYVDETKGLRRYLNGQIVDNNKNTKAFLDRLLQIQTTNPDYFTDEDTWQAEALLNIDSCVYKFVLNYADDRETVVSVRLPKYPDYVELSSINSTAPVSVYGNGKTLGLQSTGTASYMHALTRNIGSGGEAFVSASNGSNYGNATNSYGVTTNAANSGIVGTANLSTSQIKLKMRYFIQIATGSETENNIINEIELNNPYSLFDSKYSDHELNNLSWLKSEGQWNAKAVYPTVYDKLLKVYNGTETVEGLSVKLSTEEYTDYDFVLNTADETFRLPLLDGSEDLPSDRYDDLELGANGKTYTVPANGRYRMQVKGVTANTYVSAWNTTTKEESTIYVPNGWTSAQCEVSCKKGDIVKADFPSGTLIKSQFIYAEGNGSLYYYVGETVQNANLIDAGRIGEILPTKTDKVQAAKASMPSSKYIDLAIGASGAIYDTLANGWFCLVFYHPDNTTYAGYGVDVLDSSENFLYNIQGERNLKGQYEGVIMPIKSGHKLRVYYNDCTVHRFRFVYAEGVKE